MVTMKKFIYTEKTKQFQSGVDDVDSDDDSFLFRKEEY